MKNCGKFLLIVLWSYTVLRCSSVDTGASTAGHAAAIATSRNQYIELLKRGDARAIANFWTQDAIFMAPGLATVRGRSALESVLRTFFATGREPEVTLSSEDLVVSGDLAYDVGTSRQVIEIQGQPTLTINGRYLFVWKLTPDGWKIHRGIANSANP